jgi:hypothetical protein
MQWYLYASYRRWIRHVAPSTAHRWLVRAKAVLLAGNAFFLLSLIGRSLGLFDHTAVRVAIVYPSGMWFGSVILGSVILLLKDAGRFLFFWMRHAVNVLQRFAAGDATTGTVEALPPDDTRRRFLKAAGTATIAFVAATPVAASFATARDYQVRRIPLLFPNLPVELEGFSLAQISDIHSGIYMSRSDMQHIFEIVNGLRPELTVVTGDLVDTNDSEIPPLVDALLPCSGITITLPPPIALPPRFVTLASTFCATLTKLSGLMARHYPLSVSMIRALVVISPIFRRPYLDWTPNRSRSCLSINPGSGPRPSKLAWT